MPSKNQPDNAHNEGGNTQQPPTVASLLLRSILPKRFAENIMGDLDEEFTKRMQENSSLAKRWYWQQCIETMLVYGSKKFSTVSFLGRLNFYLPIFMFAVVVALISLLSNLDDPEVISPDFWGQLLQGKIHVAVLTESFWQNFQYFMTEINLGMLIDIPAIIITSFNIALLYYLDKKQQVSTLRLAIWGYALTFIPYIWTLMHLSSHNLPPKLVGPIIAMGILTILYMLIPVSYMVHKRLKTQRKREQAQSLALEQQDENNKN